MDPQEHDTCLAEHRDSEIKYSHGESQHTSQFGSETQKSSRTEGISINSISHYEQQL